MIIILKYLKIGNKIVKLNLKKMTIKKPKKENGKETLKIQ